MVVYKAQTSYKLHCLIKLSWDYTKCAPFKVFPEEIVFTSIREIIEKKKACDIISKQFFLIQFNDEQNKKLVDF